MSTLQIDAVLSQIRSMQAQIKGPGAGVGALQNDIAKVAGVGGPVQAPTNSFANVMKQGLDAVNQAQAKAADMSAKFEQGVPGIELPQVMLEMQKASVSFRAITEVRNKFVGAYQEIMNMQV